MIVLRCSKNIPSQGVRKENPPTYSFRVLPVSCTKHTSFCHALYLCLISDALVQVIQSPDHDGRFLHEMLIFYPASAA